MRARLLLVGVLLYGGVMASACTRTPSRSVARMTTSPASSVETAAAAQPSAPILTPWVVGKQYEYHLELGSTLDLGDNRRAFDFDLSGAVRAMPTAVTADGGLLYLTIDAPKFVSRVTGSQASFDKVAQEVGSTGCLVTFVAGRVTEMHVAPQLSAIAANIYRELGASLQFANNGAPSYTVEEFDTTGQYVAEYAQLGDARHWHKKKLRYLGILGSKNALDDAPSRIIPTVQNSESEIELSASGRPIAIHAKNAVLVSGTQVPVRSVTSVSLAATAEGDAPAEAKLDWNSLLAKTVRVGAEEPYGGQASVDALDDARIHGQSFETLFARLAHENASEPAVVGAKTIAPTASVEDPNLTEQAQVFIGLAALFRRKPETIALALAKIRAGARGSHGLVDALGSASSPQAQQALLALLASKNLDPKLRTRVYRAMSRVQRPTESSVKAFQSLLSEHPFDQSALFSLGSYARRLRDEGEQERSDALGEILLGQLRVAQTDPLAARVDSALISVLGGVTNSGYAKAFAPVQALVRDPRATVRAAAVRALQSMREPRVDSVLAQSLRTDPSSEVRISAIDAAKVRAPTDSVANALAAVSIDANDPRVRFRAVELMSQWLTHMPNFRSTLEAVASTDPEAKVRDRAKSAL